MALGSDAPQTDPALDAFGYAPFAQRIAVAVRETPSPQGLVMAIDGSWGAGKSTLLNFVKYGLGESSDKYKPIVIDFNPWWFNDRNHLATQLLSHFRARLPHESDVLRGIGDTMSDYAGALGKVVAFGTGISWIDVLIGALLRRLKRKHKDIPQLKSEIAAALREAGQRFLFVIDDIDRLTPDEIRELFKVVKALADFPSVIYLLSFDREVVSHALQISLQIDGDAYLEKIVQAPFVLPTVDPLKLRDKLCTDLDRLLDGSDPELFDLTYWGNVFMEGIAPLLKTPRDVVRFINTLAVTFPAVRDEVNPVDFIAMEFVRLNVPNLYDTIRENPDRFVGNSDRGIQSTERKEERAFHEAWADALDAGIRDGMQAMMERIFPRLSSSGHGSEWLKEWRRLRRACHPDVFPGYFQFSISPDQLGRKATIDFVTRLEDQPATERTLLDAIAIKHSDGTSKAKDYLDHILDYDKEIDVPRALALLRVLGRIGDRLILSADEMGGVAIRSTWRLLWVLEHALNRIAPEDRDEQLIQAFRDGEAVTFLCSLIQAMKTAHEQPITHGRAAVLSSIKPETLQSLTNIAANRIQRFATEMRLLGIPELPFVLLKWKEWVEPGAPSAWSTGSLGDGS